MKKYKKVLTYAFIVAVAMLTALNYELFIFPNKFAPAGLNGICTMIQYVFDINVGYLSMIINIPLAVMVWLKVSKPLAVRSMTYILTFSLALIILDKIDLSAFAYDTGSSAILGPLVGGVIGGSCSAMLLKASAYPGGTDFIAALIHKRRPDQSVIGMIFTMNVCVAVLSYFVYGYQMEPVILCILYSFISSTVSDRYLKNGRSAVRFEIVTDYPKEISEKIITKLHHSCTLVPGKGMYKGQEKNVLICVVNKTQVAALSAIVRKFPNTFAVMSQVSEVMGNFRHLTPDGRYEVELLDHADGKTL